jgi:hypothetical protein
MAGFTDIPPKMDPVVITYDGGGVVEKYKKIALRYRLEGREVRIGGVCRSACVYALTVPKVCVYPSAIVSAHYATDIDEGFPREEATEAILNDLPKAIGDTLRPHIEKQFNRGATLTAEQLVKLGIRKCIGKDPQDRYNPPEGLIGR